MVCLLVVQQRAGRATISCCITNLDSALTCGSSVIVSTCVILLTYCEECNKSATSYVTRMPGARDLYPFLHQFIVSFIKNEFKNSAELRSVLLDADVRVALARACQSMSRR